MADEKAIITAAAQKYGIDPKILWGLYGTETGFGKNVNTSSAGAVGPFQFLPSTAKGMGVNPYDFTSAANGAAKYLSQYKSRGTGGMLSAYNAGPGGAYQKGYVDTTLKNAQSYGGGPVSTTGVSPVPGQGTRTVTSTFTPPEQPGPGGLTPTRAAVVGRALLPFLGHDSALYSSGVFKTKMPAPPSPVTVRTQVPSGQAATPNSVPTGAGGKLAGFLPNNAQLQISRIDQGQDIQTNPGGPLLAPGDGRVIAVNDNPGGFGTKYPVVMFTSGPLAGKEVYLGHTHSALPVGASFRAGTVLSHTGFGTPAEGNARTPGWAELGLWGPNGPTGAGGQIASILRKR